MGKFRFQLAISLDGYVAGPEQSERNPIGVGGMRLHQWVFGLEAWRRAQGLEGGTVNASTPVVEEAQANVGAVVMGRNMFGGGPGPWGEEPWTGWWGDNPPFHAPVFVLTHYPREPLTMEGGTTFHFVTDGIESALAQARDAAGDKDVSLAGGANVVQQYLAAGLVDEFELHVTPVLLGGGERLFENVDGLEVEQVRAIDAPGVTHIKYRVVG
ncbi:dihydrofolate reductase [Actinobacteria bacterium YIM 96077]|uniref:Dihydrofolate reductase n=1 Tax=Phytoactinopolyspora halophila TaxID=1981511 RepID=A0A329QYT0_9ACTN|nr:dihydrofolate reductase family protein [Phytoactinopolyspora halophila]AYY13187.1 dihydrofolate reductase [Actinobacteria bacterium YIM 96077]RAW17574.1 dihydrofolate reductase [Phytoactinopolyspora halophila]